MKSKLTFVILVGFLSFGALHSCKEDDPKVQPRPVKLDLTAPMSLGKYGNLGRILFYDTRLSVNGAISCASCHKQAYGFGDNQAFSRGFENHLTVRNSIPIQNNIINFSGSGSKLFFWDGRQPFLDQMVLQPIVNHVEMGMDDHEALVERVRNIPYYPELFRSCWPNSEITADEISMALTYFVMAINTTNSRFSLSQSGQVTLSSLETEGHNLFTNKYNCGACHALDPSSNYYAPTNSTFSNIGLDVTYADPGLQNVTGNANDAGRFRVPDLNNVAVTAPYMHDGRFSTLSDVIDHYSHHIQPNANLDSRLKNASGQPIQMNISDHEKEALVAFLNTLTDYSLLTNPDLSSPFK